VKQAFEELVEPHRARLRLHCYRMLGSSSDAEDVVQEAMTRAFRSRHTLQADDMVRPWLYRIATNVCLDELKARSRRARGPELGPPSDPDAPPAAGTPESEWLEPIPSSWLEGADPASAYTIKESVALAFVAALQVLTPAQRAVLLLRDVVGLSAEETATALETSVSAASSALHRALLERYLRAWEASDLDAIVALLHDEVVLSMPPSPTWIRGRAAVARFFDNRVRQALEAHRFSVRALEANGSPAIAFYRKGDDGTARFFAIHVLALHAGGVRSIDHFMSPGATRAFFAAGLPRELNSGSS
jgi:RNA polymerase sigma-70 factor (ECF subfamily)